MKRLNRTENNLERIWDNLDNASGSLDNALHDISLMANLPKEIKDSLDRIDLSAIVILKNQIEELKNGLTDNK